MRKRIKTFVFNNPKNFLLITCLYALACTFFPYYLILGFIEQTSFIYALLKFVIKIILSVLPLIVYLSLKNDFDKLNLTKSNKILLILLYLIVCINNFPFVSIMQNSIELFGNTKTYFLHILYCFSISLFEETIFRGIILILLLKIFENKKNKDIKAILLSSALFGAIHLVNLFSGEGFVIVIVSVGYSFLTGIMFGITFCITKSIILPILLHFIFDFGGLLQSSNLISDGVIWTFGQVLITIIVSFFVVIITIFMMFKFFKGRKDNESSCSKS